MIIGIAACAAAASILAEERPAITFNRVPRVFDSITGMEITPTVTFIPREPVGPDPRAAALMRAFKFK